MDVSYGILPGVFELEVASHETELASKMIYEMGRLYDLGFGTMQMTLDLATEARSKLEKSYLLILKSGGPNAKSMVEKYLETIAYLDCVILNMKLSRNES